MLQEEDDADEETTDEKGRAVIGEDELHRSVRVRIETMGTQGGEFLTGLGSLQTQEGAGVPLRQTKESGFW